MATRIKEIKAREGVAHSGIPNRQDERRKQSRKRVEANCERARKKYEEYVAKQTSSSGRKSVAPDSAADAGDGSGGDGA